LPGYTKRDRTFFFFSYEGLRLRQPQFNLTNVPSLCLRGLGSCTGGQVPAAAALFPILNSFPLPNGKVLLQTNGTPNGLAELNIGYSIPSNLDATSIRVDHAIGSRLTLF